MDDTCTKMSRGKYKTIIVSSIKKGQKYLRYKRQDRAGQSTEI